MTNTRRMRGAASPLLTGLIMIAALVVVIFQVGPVVLDKRFNSVAHPGPDPASAAAQRLHQQLFVADLHDDMLLWSRNPLLHYSYGQSDLPRLRAGRVALQVFSTVTKTPKNLNFERNTGDTDNVTPLVMIQRWPQRTWGSLAERALYQAEKFHTAVAQSHGALRVVRTRSELSEALNAPAGTIAGVLATEGLHALEGRLDNLDRLHAAGFRMAGLAHFFDNELGGSAHGVDKGGITDFGRAVVARMEALGVIVDLAHSSPALFNDTLALAKKPVVVSHTGVAATCPGPRNLTDEQLRALAANGALIGIGYFEGAVCDISPAGIARAIRHAASVAGIRHIALGSDYNGAVHTTFDAAGLVHVTAALQAEGFSDKEIAAIMGENARRFLLNNLPE
jgi:membrane dipeptidase